MKCLEYHWPQYSHYLVDLLVVAADFGSTCHPQTEVLRCSSCYQINPEQNHDPKQAEEKKQTKRIRSKAAVKKTKDFLLLVKIAQTYTRTHSNLTTTQISDLKKVVFNNRIEILRVDFIPKVIRFLKSRKYPTERIKNHAKT